MVLLVVKAFGAAVRIIFDIEPSRLKLAEKLGVTHILNPVKGDIIKETPAGC